MALKHSTEGTDEYAVNRDACTEVLLQGFKDHATRTKAKISGLPVSSKKWWKLCSALMVKKDTNCNIPPLLCSDGAWALTPTSKADLLAKTFQDKFIVADGMEDDVPIINGVFESGFLLVRSRWTLKILSNLDESSSTGPDGLPSQVLKYCARELALPITKLIRFILVSRKWPEFGKFTGSFHFIRRDRAPLLAITAASI